MLAEFDGIMSIVDFKTSKWPKDEEKVAGYYLQTTIYAMMVEELLGIEVPQLAILIGVDDEPAQVFLADSHTHREEVVRLAALG
jgi:genome maintenance exonuclease 1